MSEFFDRQIAVLHQLIGDYREGKLTLNTVIQRVQAVGDVLEIDAWKEAVFPIIWSMEQISAFALEAKQDLTEEENDSIKNSLLELEALIGRFDAGEANG
jgi:hypothetical protein